MLDKIGVYISFIIYLAGMIGVGVYFYRRSKDFDDYVLAGRGLNYWVTSLSAQASDMSGWLLLGLPGFAFLNGISALWLAGGLAFGTWLNWQFVAKRLRVFSEVANNSLTIPTFLSVRFKEKRGILRLVTSLFILLFFLIYTSSGFVAGAKLFSNILALNYYQSLAIGAVIIVVYTFLGGFNAVSWTDFIQGTIMFLAVIIVPVTLIIKSGGIGASLHFIEENNVNLLNVFHQPDGTKLGMISVLSLLGWGLGYFGQPHILARFMAIKNPAEVVKAKKIAMGWVLVSLTFAVVIGMAGYVFFQGKLDDSEQVFFMAVNQNFHQLMAGMLLAAVLAAVMSTADSQLLVASTSFTEDIYRNLLKREPKQNELIRVSRVAVAVIALIAVAIASNPESKVLDLVEFAWGGFGASLGPAILFSLYWKKTTVEGVIAGIVSGGLVVLVWRILSGGIFDLYEIIPGFIVSGLMIFLVSRWTLKSKQVLLYHLYDQYHEQMVKMK